MKKVHQGHLYTMNYLLVISFFFATTVYGQSMMYQYTDSMKKNDSVLSSKVVHQPEFPGGESEMIKYVNNGIASIQIVSGLGSDLEYRTKIVLRFIINEDGTISDIIVRRSMDEKIDKQIVAIVKSLPRFYPALDMNSRAVKAPFIFPIQFEIGRD